MPAITLSSILNGPTRRAREAIIAASFAGAISAGVLLWAVGDIIFTAAFAAAFCAIVALILLFVRARADNGGTAARPADWTLMGAALDASEQPVAITDRSGRLVCANAAFASWFPSYPAPPALSLGDDGGERLAAGGRAGWRDGLARVEGLFGANGSFDAEIVRAGTQEDHLVWRLRPTVAVDLVAEARKLIEGEGGNRLGMSGVMAALVEGRGRMIAANRALLKRGLGNADAPLAGRNFVDLVTAGEDDLIRLVAEGEHAGPLRLLQIALGDDASEGPALFLMLDEEGAVPAHGRARGTAAVHLHGLLAMLPLGLALAERDGRIVFMNDAFRRAAGLPDDQAILYPGDLLVKEDKAAVSDAVRRFAAGQRMSGDIAVRLRFRPEEPVVLTIAGARGLGDATILLSLKDNSEESKLKRQVAQATKMQAVGQLAGGVAHDFNNILTAVIGHCDLIMMRHTPGDSDYDDIQQIKQNANRAAGLTRQLLAFSRQQTLRPQILQLPDVISEISNLVKRLLGETISFTVKHGRGLGAVRADPGQLEQVIVNLAVNARDAMPDGGTLTLQTYSVAASEVNDIGSEVMPIGNYTALSVSDTGSGIAPDILSKIFEPFFTTKEVGKGTGLGLSTVYGIVKQSGGFIFAESTLGKGTNFIIYLPVHRADPSAVAVPAVREKAGELWGTGTILLVEDEDMVRAVAERALTRQGYKVLTAAHGEEALEILRRGDPVDLLISDVVMPTMDGPTMARHARETHPDLPILFMSGYAEEQLRKSIDLTAVVFLPKPFSVQQLAQAARDALAKKNH